MNNKILISIVVPTVQMEFDVYIPNNKKIGTIKKYILNSIRELSDGYYNFDINKVLFIDKDTGLEFDNNIYVNDSQIKNGSKIVII